MREAHLIPPIHHHHAPVTVSNIHSRSPYTPGAHIVCGVHALVRGWAMVWYADGIRAVLCGKEARAGSFASAGRPRREAGPTSQGSCAARVRVRVVKILPSTALAASAAALAATLAAVLLLALDEHHLRIEGGAEQRLDECPIGHRLIRRLGGRRQS